MVAIHELDAEMLRLGGHDERIAGREPSEGIAARLLVEVRTGNLNRCSAARQRLGTTRRVVLPLLAFMDRRGLTTRHPDDRRTVR